MYPFRSSSLALLSVFFVSILSSEVTPLWIQMDGIVVMEAEKGSAETTEEWIIGTDVPDYLGEGFIRWEGRDFLTNSGHGRLAYRFYIQEGGTYQMFLRSFHDPESRGKRKDEENDCWVNFDFNQPEAYYKTFRNSSLAGRPWSSRTEWVAHSERGEVIKHAVYELERGEYTFRIAARANHFMIDRIVLVPIGEADRVDVEAVESPINGITYDDWMIRRFSAEDLGNPELEGRLWGPSGDPDKDGLSNAYEFYAGGNPLLADRNTCLVSTIDNGEVVLRLRKAEWITGVQLIAESSANLNDWTDTLTLIKEEVIDEKVWMKCSYSINGGPASYLRFILEIESERLKETQVTLMPFGF